ncbi:MAG: leucine-rich repeat protein, partial [Clostridiales bacterium]|nr:leucine-rich repeat protein [Clostridiales bacterium]
YMCYNIANSFVLFYGGLMKKRYIALISTIAAAVCFGAFVSCGKNTDGNSTAPEHVWGDEYTMSAAYQKATELGYKGTLEEFIESISGKDGVDGADGKDGVGIKSVTVNADGEIVITDTNGKVIFKEKLPLCPHVYSESEVGLPAGCTYAGYSVKVCKNCGDKDYTVLPPLNHDWDKGTIVYEQTCAKNGYMYYTCRNCGETKSQVLDATGEHSFKNGACEYCGLNYAVYIDEYYNNDYGYRYLATMPNGDGRCAFYNDIADAVTTFHNDDSADAQYDESAGYYILKYIDYAKYGLKGEDAVAVWKTYTDDKPLYYWMLKNTTIDGTKLALMVQEEYADGGARTAYNTKLYGMIDKYVDLASGENAYTVALAYHDKIIEAIDYAYDENRKPETAAWAHNITGVFDGKGAVCEGYSHAFQLLLNVRGINNMFVTGNSMNSRHAWNMVEINGEWYWFDLTYDDTPNYFWGISHDYFCVTDEKFLKNHTVDDGTEVYFMYDLPKRAQNPYAGDDAIFFDTFTVSGAEYVVVGYDTVDISYISASGNFAIPPTVSHRGRDYSVVSIMQYKDGQSVSVGSVPSDDITSLHIPATIKYIDDLSLDGKRIETFTVDENNVFFSAVDGVLFSKNMTVLIAYPVAKKSAEYRIPDQTQYIAHGAFRAPSYGETLRLEKLIIGKNVQLVGYINWGFGYFDTVYNIMSGVWKEILTLLGGAKQLEIHEKNPYFIIKDEMVFNKSLTNLYAGLPGIKRAVIPESVTYVESSAFKKCSQLVSVKFQSGIEKLPQSVFSECTSLQEAILPDPLLIIDDFAFSQCSALKSISIPATVQCIKRYAFDNCSSLEKIILPDGLNYLDYKAFESCEKITVVVVPKNVEFVVAENVYYPLPNLYYKGTAEEWETVDSKFTYFDYYYGDNTVNIYFYSEEQPTAEGNYWHYVDGKPTAW